MLTILAMSFILSAVEIYALSSVSMPINVVNLHQFIIILHLPYSKDKLMKSKNHCCFILHLYFSLNGSKNVFKLLLCAARKMEPIFIIS